MNQDRLVMFDGQVNVLQEDRRFVFRILVQSDLANSKDTCVIEELGNHGDDFA